MEIPMESCPLFTERGNPGKVQRSDVECMGFHYRYVGWREVARNSLQGHPA